MTVRTSKQKLCLKHRWNSLKDRVGLPVNYTSDEAKQFKLRVDPAQIQEFRIARLAHVFGATHDEVAAYVAEAMQLPFVQRRDEADQNQKVPSPMSTDDSVSLYAVVRLAKPRVAIETGTAAGASATYILEAMCRNGHGQLHSIDMLHDPKTTGMLVPQELRRMVQLHTGNSLKVIPELVKELDTFDFFLHDSNHTYKHMMAEYELAHGLLTGGRVIASHDVLYSNAWHHFINRRHIRCFAEIRNFGVCIAP